MRAIQITEVSRAYLVAFAIDPMMAIDLPPVDWFVRGPRGGLYEATGQRERFIDDSGDKFLRNVVAVVDVSDGIRYLRPGTARYRHAAEAL